MSSPRREAKIVAKAIVAEAAKPRHKPRAVARPVPAAANGASAEAQRLAATIERGIVDGKLDMVTTEALQKLMAAACRVYTARMEAGDKIAPISKNSISATDVMVTASGLLKAADLAVFELGMWQSWTGR